MHVFANGYIACESGVPVKKEIVRFALTFEPDAVTVSLKSCIVLWCVCVRVFANGYIASEFGVPVKKEIVRFALIFEPDREFYFGARPTLRTPNS